MRTILSERCRVCSAMLASLLGAVHVHADASVALHELGAAEGVMYVAQRDALLESHPDPWDVEKACAYSWQAGLAAFILNARLTDSGQFAEWDRQIEQVSKAVHLPMPAAGFRRVNVGAAFRMEFAWKPPDWVSKFRWGTAAANRDPEAAARSGALAPNGLYAPIDDVPLALWRVIWRQCNLSEFRAVAIGVLARSDSLEDQQAARSALLDVKEALEIRRVAIYSIAARAPEDSVDDLIQIGNDFSTSTELAVVAISALANNSSRLTAAYPRVRAFLEATAANDDRPVELRSAAVEACKQDRRSSSVAVLREALMHTKAPQLQLAAIREEEELRPALKHAMYNYGDLNVVSAAATALLNLGNVEDLDFIRAYLGDATVSEEARQRAASALQNFGERERVSEKLERDRKERMDTGKNLE